MTATSLGLWRAYRPTEMPESLKPPQPAEQDNLVSLAMLNQMFVNTLFLRDEQGNDWYEFVKTLDPSVTYVGADETGEVRTASNDPTALVPQNLEVFALDTYVADLNTLYFRNVQEL